jgi:hypothetical protein
VSEAIMEFYADIIRNNGEDKIDLFCECVEILNLKGWDIKKFAKMCGFELVSVQDIRGKSQ